MNKTLSILLAMNILSGCAGMHSIPPKGYSSEVQGQADTIRVAFDQWGDLYPLSEPAVMPKNCRLKLTGEEISVRKFMAKEGHEYSNETIEKQYQDTAQQISKKLMALGDDTKLVFLIHGYNNSFWKASQEYKPLKNQISELGGKYLFVEIYWDGLYPRLDVKPFNLPLFYWFDAMTYSNYAGQYGLRRLVNNLKGIEDMTFVTHSRGAAVAYSTFANPAYDTEKGIVNSLPSPVLKTSDLKSVNMLMIAPAVGKGHKFEQLPGGGDLKFNVWLGFNPLDGTLKKKLKKGHKIMGSTELGVSEDYFLDQQERITNPNISLNREQYCSKYHGLGAYLYQKEVTNCLLSRAGLIDAPHASCSALERCMAEN